MTIKTKTFMPPPLMIDGEVFSVMDESHIDPTLIYVNGPHMNLSPYEAEQLRDWLSHFLEWHYQEDKK